MIIRHGEPPENGRQYVPRPGAYAILLRGTQILLTHQAEPEPEFQLPGGGIDPGEAPMASLYREILEETGWSATGLRRIGVYRRFTYMPEYDKWAEKICQMYLGRPALCHGDPREVGHTAVWADLHDAPAMVASPGDRDFLMRVIRNQVG